MSEEELCKTALRGVANAIDALTMGRLLYKTDAYARDRRDAIATLLSNAIDFRIKAYFDSLPKVAGKYPPEIPMAVVDGILKIGEKK